MFENQVHPFNVPLQLLGNSRNHLRWIYNQAKRRKGFKENLQFLHYNVDQYIDWYMQDSEYTHQFKSMSDDCDMYTLFLTVSAVDGLGIMILKEFPQANLSKQRRIDIANEMYPKLLAAFPDDFNLV